MLGSENRKAFELVRAGNLLFFQNNIRLIVI